MKEIKKYLKNTFLSTLVISLLSGCQSTPKEPKQPAPYPRFPINKTIPPELPQNGCMLQESLPPGENE